MVLKGYDRALLHYTQSFKMARKLHNSALVGVAYKNLGNTFRHMHTYTKAVDCFRKYSGMHVCVHVCMYAFTSIKKQRFT